MRHRAAMEKAMNSQNNAGISRLHRILTVAGFVLITLLCASPGSAQTVTPGADESELTVEDLYKASGKLLGMSTDKQPAGPLLLKSYKVEEVPLRHALTLGRGANAKVINNIVRLTITVGSPLQGAYVIFLDDEPRQAVVTERDAVSAVFFDAKELEDGAQISVASGWGCNTDLLSTMKTTLRLPEPYKFAKRGDADPGHAVKKIRTMRARPGSNEKDEVEIQLTTPAPLPVTNQGYVLEIGGVAVAGGDGYIYGDRNTLGFRMSLEQFTRAEDGKRVKVKSERCGPGGLRFGKLNKAQLDQ
jgi:hypothetical protein